MVPTRRQTLATLGVTLTGVAGCTGFGDPDLVIENELGHSVTVTVDITRLSDRRVIENSVDRSIDSGDTTEFLNPFDEPTEYRIQILTSEKNVGGETTVQADDGSLKVRATITSDGLSFSQQT